MNSRAIGVFDSGIGGLTVLHAIMQALPAEDLNYLGDTARVPYGTKSSPTVIRYALEAADFLCREGAKALVVACNTASSVALPALAERHGLPIIGVIEPGAARAAASTRNGRIGIIGTEATVASGAYVGAIRALAPTADIHSAACPLFVPLAEEGWYDHAIAELAAREYLAPLVAAGIDTLVLGCTHYPLFKETLRRVLGPQVTLVDSAEETARTLSRLLGQQGLCRAGAQAGRHRFFVTDVPDRFVRVGGAFLGRPLDGVQQVRLD